jgi:hypothetical protein
MEGGKKEKRKREDDFSIWAHGGVRKTPCTPLRFPFRVIPSLQLEGYLNQLVAEKEKKEKRKTQAIL